MFTYVLFMRIIINHQGDLPPGTLNSILKQAGLK